MYDTRKTIKSASDLGEGDFEAMLEMEESKSPALQIGDRIAAKVIRIGKDYLFLDLGTRDEGLLSVESLGSRRGETLPKIGEVINVYITALREGAVLCGLTATETIAEKSQDDKQGILDTLKEAFDTGMPVDGTIKESIKGGFSVNIMGNRSFCPISQIDKSYCENPDEHLGRTYQFEIIKFEENGRNLVVSRRKILEREASEKAAVLWGEIQVGNTYPGKVTAIKPYGAFVDIGGLEGLVHISEIDYGQTTDPADHLSIGQEITVAVKEIDRMKKRISLSLKALKDDPWDEADKMLKKDQVLAGRVTRTQNFGAFVELMPGVEGLIHISNMTREKRLHSPLEMVSHGQEVMVRILDINPDARRISLTMIMEEDKDESWREALAQSPPLATGGMGTLGDLFSKKIKK
jgi:small subunit ribosomal protein S1